MPAPDEFSKARRRLRKKLSGSKWTTTLDCSKQEGEDGSIGLEFQKNSDLVDIRSGVGSMAATCGHLANQFTDMGDSSSAVVLSLIGAQLLLLWDKLERDAAVNLN